MNRPERQADHSSPSIVKEDVSSNLQPYRPSVCSQYAAHCFKRYLTCNVYLVGLHSLYSHIPQYTKYSIPKSQLYPVTHSTFDKRYITVVTSSS